MIIETSEFVLRNWKAEDAEDIVRIANNKEIFDNVRDSFPQPYTLKDALDFIAEGKENNGTLLIAIEVNGKAAGNMGVTFKSDVYRKNAEIGYYLSEEHWGKGIMTKVIKKTVEYCFENYDIIRIYAEVFTSNIACIRALEKAGFIHEATFKSNIIKNGVIGDSCIYSILKDRF
jgi:RimJ/RimL family protein N-acetyltransferase